MHPQCSRQLWAAHQLPEELWPSTALHHQGGIVQDKLADSQERGVCGQHLCLRGSSQGLIKMPNLSGEVRGHRGCCVLSKT